MFSIALTHPFQVVVLIDKKGTDSYSIPDFQFTIFRGEK